MKNLNEINKEQQDNQRRSLSPERLKVARELNKEKTERKEKLQGIKKKENEKD